jgi:hypothetical protein
MLKLERITSEYIEAEDRIRLSGEVASGETVVIWLTRRLMQRLLPALIQLFQGQHSNNPYMEMMQGFAQQAAQSEFKPQAPVSVTVNASSWVAMAVDVSHTGQVITLNFRAADGQSAILAMDALPLRQWLSIVYGMYVKAEWPVDVWPNWISERVPQKPVQGVVMH